MVRKPNQKIPRPPLQPIPAFEEPLSTVLIDCVGPLPKSKSGNEYYANRDENNAVQCANIVSPVPQNCNNVCDTQNSQDFENKISGLSCLQNSDILCNLDSKLEHLEDPKIQLHKLTYEYKHLFPDVPTITNNSFHNVDVGDGKPIKQHLYRSNPVKQQILKKEIQYL